jgi:hypothetical protein
MNHLNDPPRQRFLWQTWISLLAAAVPMLSGCSTPLVIDRAIGPDPFSVSNAAAHGELQVFTMKQEENNVGFEFPFYQRTAYSIYTPDGRHIKVISDNNCGHFDDTPPVISLAPGAYSIRGFMAEDLGQFTVLSVVIERGRKTEVHLDGHWQSPGHVSQNQLVRAPNGFLLGWPARSPSN